MGNLFAYSGVSTKLRAIQSRLFTREEYLELASCQNVTEAVNYLRRHPGYQQVFAQYEGEDLHREKIENILEQMTGIDFQKIYRFCSMQQRNFLDMYFQKYEIGILKKCLGMIFDHRDVQIDLSYFKDFFSHHSRLDPERLAECKNVDMLLAAVEHTQYASCLGKVRERPDATLWDYEVALDYEFFLDFWNQRKKYLKGEALEMVTEIYGVKMELLNIQWLVRGKKYYNMSPPRLYAMMLPVGVHLNKAVLRRMTDAATPEEFRDILAGTYYGKHYPQFGVGDTEQMYTQIRQGLQHKLARREPYSLAVIVSYIFDKEFEIDRLTSILECIRYGIDAQTALSL